MLQEPDVVVSGEIGAIVAAAAFFAGQRRAHHQQTRDKNVPGLESAAGPGMRGAALKALQFLHGVL